jgi:hypothetical protein
VAKAFASNQRIVLSHGQPVAKGGAVFEAYANTFIKLRLRWSPNEDENDTQHAEDKADCV